MINIGKYIEMAINWLTENFAGLFDVINHIVGGYRRLPGNTDVGPVLPDDCGNSSFGLVESRKGNCCPDLARFTFDLGDGVLGTDHADCGACLVVDDHRLVVRCPAGNLDRAKR